MKDVVDGGFVKKRAFLRTSFFKRVFSSWKSTIARLFVFTLCVSAIIALSVNSRGKAPNEQHVASSSLPVQTEDGVSVENTADIDDVSTIEASESKEFAFVETPIDVENEGAALEQLEETTSDSEVLATDTVVEAAPTVAESSPEEAENVELCATNASFELRTGSISEIQIGYRVPGTNPEGNDGSDEAAFASEDLYIFTFRVPKADGTFCKAKLLRSANWLLEQPSRCVSAFDGHEFNEIDAAISDQSPYYFDWNFQFEVWIDLSEFGCVGWSKVVEIDDTFKYVPGEGNLVTGTFEHIAQETIDLQIEGQEKPIGCTPTHPIWSEDREEFVPAGDLIEGERVRVLNGDTKRVVQKLPRPGPEVVYNLEVFGEHVYHVTSDGVLVHNHDCGGTVDRRNVSGFATISPGKKMHPMVEAVSEELLSHKGGFKNWG